MATTATLSVGDKVIIKNPYCDPRYYNQQGTITVSETRGSWYDVRVDTGYYRGTSGSFRSNHLEKVREELPNNELVADRRFYTGQQVIIKNPHCDSGYFDADAVVVKPGTALTSRGNIWNQVEITSGPYKGEFAQFCSAHLLPSWGNDPVRDTQEDMDRMMKNMVGLFKGTTYTADPNPTKTEVVTGWKTGDHFRVTDNATTAISDWVGKTGVVTRIEERAEIQAPYDVLVYGTLDDGTFDDGEFPFVLNELEPYTPVPVPDSELIDATVDVNALESFPTGAVLHQVNDGSNDSEFYIKFGHDWYSVKDLQGGTYNLHVHWAARDSNLILHFLPSVPVS